MSSLPQNTGTRAEWLDELRDALRPVYDQKPLIERCLAYSRSR